MSETKNFVCPCGKGYKSFCNFSRHKYNCEESKKWVKDNID